MKNSLISSLAYLKINSDRNKTDYLDNFVPLIAECLRNSKEEAIDVSVLQDDLCRCFGIVIPINVIKLLLRRAKKKDFVYVKDHVYYRKPEELHELNFVRTQTKVQRIYTALIDNFKKFCSTKYSKKLTDIKAEQIILAFISYNQVNFFIGNEDLKVLPDLPDLITEEKVMIADYITSISKSDPENFEYIETIVKGYMILNALYLPDPNKTDKKFRNTEVYFDTSFIIFALGYTNYESKNPCIELLDLLYANGAHLRCFKHTIDEIKGILYACSERLGSYDDSIFGRSIEFFITHGYSQSDVLLLISTLERKIEGLRIRIVDKPDYKKHEHVIDEDELYALFEDKVGYKNEDPIEKDVDSIAAIYRLRRDESYYSLEETKAIFVTSNNTLSRVTNSYFYQDHDRSSIAPSITDFALTNIVWLKTPTTAPDLPIKRIIADCYAAIQPSDALMSKWIYEINKLKDKGELSIDDYYFMRFSEEAKITLIEFSLGKPDVITEGSIPEILEEAKRRITQDANQQIEKYSSELEISQEEKATLERKEIERKDRIKLRSVRFSKIISKIIRILSFVILILLMVFTFPFDILNNQEILPIYEYFPSFLPPLVFFILLVLNFCNQYWGTSIMSLINRIEVFIGKKIFLFLEKLTE